MLWNRLPLIEMDEVSSRKKAPRKSRFSSPERGERLEKDIGKQLSELREQTKSGDDKKKCDPFGRDQGLRRSERDEKNRSDDLKTKDDREDRGSQRDRRRSPRDDRDRYYSDDSDHGSYEERSRNGDRSRSRYKDDYHDDRRERDYRDRDHRDRDRDYYRDRDYRSRDDDRDEDWRRDRHDDDDYRHGSREKSRHEDDGRWVHDRYYDDRDQRREYTQAQASEIVILKGLPSMIEDSRIHEIMTEANLPYKDVRVVKNKEGYSRGFAFVEFLDTDTAKGWVDKNNGKLQMDDTTVYMDFSRSNVVTEPYKDWICSKCGTQNFSSKKRNTCFSCYAPRDENDEQKDVGQTPCKVLILRGLDTLTTEETIRHCLTSFTTIPIFDVRLIKDKMTGTSRGFCFVELASVEEASKLREDIQEANLKIDERTVAVSYARFATHPGSKGGMTGKTNASTSETATSDASTTSVQARPKNRFAANAIAQAHAASKMGHDVMPQHQMMTQQPYSASTQALPYVAPDSSTYSSTGQTSVVATTSGQSGATTSNDGTYSVPGAVSSYVYDPASGFYYDTTTGLYYDPKTQYYYNSSTQQYMFWDATTQQYVAVMSSNSGAVATNTSSQSSSNGNQSSLDVNPYTNTVAQAATDVDAPPLSKEKQKKAKAFNAKKIAKDMERWAKKMNVNKESQARVQTAAQMMEDATKESSYQYDPNDLRAGVQTTFSDPSNVSLSSASPLAALSDLGGTTTATAQSTAASSAASASLVAEYGEGDSGGEDDANKEESYSDWTKMACLLCKRQFPSKDVLAKHNQFSDLHKQNLQVQKKLKMSFDEINDYEKQQREAKYRDRAKERRELFGQPDSGGPSSKRRRKGKGPTYEQPTKDGITSDNIGNKMLQAMGWTQGTGLGKERQGIVAPISAKVRNRTAGLGLEGSHYGAVAGDTDRDMLKKMASSRYNALE